MDRIINPILRFLSDNYNEDIESNKVEKLVFEVEESIFDIMKESFEDGYSSGLNMYSDSYSDQYCDN